MKNDDRAQLLVSTWLSFGELKGSAMKKEKKRALNKMEKLRFLHSFSF